LAVKDYVFEVGGASKDQSQIKGLKNAYLIKDDIVYKEATTVPLYAFGMLY
jgi:hypothetical protein